MLLHTLPTLQDRLFITDGGLETTLVFHDGVDLPHFAAFPLLETEAGTAWLRAYYRRYAAIAEETGAGFVLESPTWRANADWGARLGYTPQDLDRVNRRAIDLLEALRAELAPRLGQVVVSGCIGPQGDGYAPATHLSIESAEAYHAPQIATFAGTSADLVSAMTLTYSEEAIGITRAAKKAGIPCVVSLTVETDGRLPSGESLSQAIERIDAATGDYAAYFMINCAHPAHFEAEVRKPGRWLARIRGLRANASRLSHEELDQAEALDDGNPVELAHDHVALLERLPHVNVLGGCCGTDHRHVAAIARACAARGPSPG